MGFVFFGSFNLYLTQTLHVCHTWLTPKTTPNVGIYGIHENSHLEMTADQPLGCQALLVAPLTAGTCAVELGPSSWPTLQRERRGFAEARGDRESCLRRGKQWSQLLSTSC